MATSAVPIWLRGKDENAMIKKFDADLVPQFGLDVLKAFVDKKTKHHHAIVHELAKQGKIVVLRHLVEQHDFDINVQRSSDLCTPLHLALWGGQRNVVQQLERMGADASIKNSYGEDARQVSELQKPIRARLQGSISQQEILSLVGSELHNFNAIDTITAYFRLAEISAVYDVGSSTWSSAGGGHNLRDDPSFQQLTLACTRTLCQHPFPDAGFDAGNLWATMLSALAMLPDSDVIAALTRRVTEQQLPLSDWSPGVLHRIVWGIAKMEGGTALWRAWYVALGNELSCHIQEMEVRHVSTIVWAFAKAGTSCSLNHPLAHRDLISAVARYLRQHGSNLTECRDVSVFAWSFAKLSEHHPEAFVQLALSGIRLSQSFEAQHVANTAWAFAKLRHADQTLFIALLQRADAVLYGAILKDHLEVAQHWRIAIWCQVYLAYCFCLETCPDAIAALTRRLAADLQRIRRSRGSTPADGLSQGSGMESAQSLRELDELICANERDPMAWLPLESLETENEPAPQVAAQNAERVSSIFQTCSGTQGQVRVVILKFSRSPNSFRMALLEGPELLDCRSALQEAGMEVVLERGAKIFMRPEHYWSLREAIQQDGMQLFSSHVLVAAEFEHLVLQALASIPGSEQVHRNGQDQVQVPVAWDSLSASLNLSVTRSLISFPATASIWSRA
eukprot:TRINITY_DN49143_c0_g1_i1.p1 TRINITY_DN49143_c0_g1~~TRINITY_DN49143_c0_g1_i1.p1  ORF type:complete len:698 (+),score=112.78 TRINITY_DN49143_c0_g1_i1:62-2095(+)